MNQKNILFLTSSCVLSVQLHAAGVNAATESTDLAPLEITSASQPFKATSATMGTVLTEQIEQRPLGRPGELLETVPGLIVTQHSGEGKANQYFLRGFNLDHGTDLATFIDGMPVNNRTHGHGQGYTDINFIIPEMIESLDYKKGPYYATEGDFSNAGAVRLHTKSSMSGSMIKLGLGEYGFQRSFLATGTDNFVAALDMSRYDGPWEVPQDQEKNSAFLKYSLGDAVNGAAVSLMGFENRWTATDQLPQRYVENGGDLYDSLDSDSGGASHRYSLNYQGWNDFAGRNLSSSFYVIDYGLELFSNFSYATDPINGDEMRQHDERKVVGGTLLFDAVSSARGVWQVGLDVQQDLIADTGLSASSDRSIRERTIRHRVDEISLGILLQNQYAWTDAFTMQLGLRWDYIEADVENRLNGADNQKSADLFSPKVSAIYSLTAETHLFANYGRGFHSNDARGFAEGNVNDSSEKADVFARSEGADVGVQSQLTDTLQLAASLWWLKLDSELVFLGDDGTTEASDESERRGIEASIFWQPESWLMIDSDVAFTRARLKPENGAEQYIAGAIERVFSLGMTLHDFGPWQAGMRLRHFGDFALNEDNSERADAVTLLNAQVGFDVSPAFNLSLEVINLTDAEGNDITYLYESQLATESAPVEDVHFHPVEPRMLRAGLTYRF
jgi:outer membrane receptor protein involved in Fe transport